MNHPTNHATAAGEPPGDPATNGTAALGEHGRAVGEDAGRLAEDLGRLADEVERFLARRLERSPYGTLAAAAGAGYVLGGGVPPWLLRVGLAVSGRAVTNVLLREVFTPDAPAPRQGDGAPPPAEGGMPPAQ